MKVTVNVYTLLQKIQSLNKDLDLTGVKAYLFDLMTNTESHAEERTKVYTETRTTVIGDTKKGYVVEPELEPDTLELDSVPEDYSKILGPETPSKRAVSDYTPSAKKTSGQVRREERQARRDRSSLDFSKMSGKQVMEALASKSMAKPDDTGQFTNLGNDNVSSGGDLEIG